MKSERGRIHEVSLLLSLLILCMPVVANAELVPSISLERLAKDADVIVVGNVMTIEVIGTETTVVNADSVRAQRKRASLKPSRFLKGQVSEELVTIDFFEPQTGFRFPAVLGKEFGMFFLKK